MQYTENYNLYKPVYGEPTDVADLNHNADEIDGLIHDNRTMIAPAYDTAVSYVVGDIVEHLGKVYKCTGATTGVWDSAKWTQTTLADEIEEGAGGVSALDDLTDVDLSTPTDGQALLYDGTAGKWKNATLPTPTVPDELNDLDDVDITTPADGEVLVYDSARGKWVNAEIETATSLEELTDTDITTPDDGDILVYDETDDVWKNQPQAVVAKTVSGNPIELTDAAAAPLVKCVTQITGSQDLHGYDKPWPPGAGKNKFGGEFGTSYKYPLPSGGTITASAKSDGVYKLNLRFYDSTDTKVGSDYAVVDVGSTSGTVSPSVPSGAEKFILFISGGGQASNFSEVQVESGSTATTYSPYSNICPITAYSSGSVTVADDDTDPTVTRTNTATWTENAFSGTIDWVNQKLVITHRKVSVTSFNRSNSHGFWANSPSWTYPPAGKQYDVSRLRCEQFPTLSSAPPTGEAIDGVYINSSGGLNLRTYKAYGSTSDLLNDVGGALIISYTLATPIEVDIEPTNLPIKSLFGYNHIESSTGDMEIEYITENYQPVIEATDISIEDHGKKIESIIPENLEPLMKASRNYTIGELIISGDKAYRATANIASGATLTVNTNVVATTIEEEIGRSGHVYSTTEQVVGTWIDGSTLYAKSYHVSTVTSTYTTIDSNITCNNAKIRNSSMGTITVGGAYDNAQYVDGRISQYAFARIILKTGGLTVGMENPPSDPITDFDFTIQYTKSSS